MDQVTLYSINVKGILGYLGGGEGGGGEENAQKPKIRDRPFFSEKKPYIQHFARFIFSRLLLAFILKYCTIVSCKWRKDNQTSAHLRIA